MQNDQHFEFFLAFLNRRYTYII